MNVLSKTIKVNNKKAEILKAILVHINTTLKQKNRSKCARLKVRKKGSNH